jgi:hypothetical protein
MSFYKAENGENSSNKQDSPPRPAPISLWMSYSVDRCSVAVAGCGADRAQDRDSTLRQ